MADGTIISDGNGNYKIAKGGQWVDYTGPPPGATGRGGKSKFSPQAQNFLNELSRQASEASETRRVYDRAKQDVKTLKPGPWRGQFLDMALPTEGGGVMDAIGSTLIGVPARMTGAITPEEVDAYQHMKGLQSQQVLQAQLAQKGPQTESDAARMALTELSPNKTSPVNLDVIKKGSQKADRVRAKAIFYSRWSNKYGDPNAADPNGMTAAEVWNKAQDHIVQRLFGGGQTASTIKVISRTKVK